jgi:vancomycin resistance protein YoaR
LKATADKVLKPVAAQVKVPAVDAHLRWYNGQVQVQTAEQLGRELDLDATVTQVIQAIREGKSEVAILTKDVKPQVTGDMAGSIQVREKISEAYTSYGTSAPNRWHNVETAANRVNGELVPPGGTFSFNHAVGPVTFDSGYRTGYGIIATNGSISTVPSVGGGICQVATTVFQAAFWAGMPIIDRSWHLYWIPRYGQPPSGMQGLDATVDPDYGLDFTFKNATNDWIAIVSRVGGGDLTFEIWGTNPGWEIIVDQPVITNYKPASQEMVYEYSDELPAGQSVFVEHAEAGFDAAIHRVVKKDGQVIDEKTFISTYEPARNVTLVGTGG